VYWDDVLKEVLNKDSKHRFTNLGEENNEKPRRRRRSDQTKRRKIMYQLGEKFKNIHFSKREAECMVHLLKGKSIRGAAKLLGLSPRTVEFYVANMKNKVNCRTKFELVELVMDSDFLGGIDFG
jgi:DNA-binding CsgD family transcriptional regulator